MNNLLPLAMVPLMVWVAVWIYLWRLDNKVSKLIAEQAGDSRDGDLD